MRQCTENEPSHPNETERIINERFERELLRTQKDFDAAADNYNVAFAARTSYYGPTFLVMVGSFFPFFFFKDEVDIINVTIGGFLIFNTYSLIKNGLDYLDGKGGIIDCWGERFMILSDIRSRGLKIDSKDYISQGNWILEQNELISKITAQTSLDETESIIRRKIQKCILRITILMPVLVGSFLAKMLPIEKCTDKKSGWFDFFIPEYLQFRCYEAAELIVLGGTAYLIGTIFCALRLMKREE